MPRTKAVTGPALEIIGMPSKLEVEVEQEYKVKSITSPETEGTMVEVKIEYSGLSRSNGDFTVYYKEGSDWLELLEDRFGPASGFPFTNGVESELKIVGHKAGTVTTTMIVEKIDDHSEVCRVENSVEFTKKQPEPQPEPSEKDSTPYIVKGGETLQGLAYRFGKSTKQFMKENNIPKRRRLFKGESLSILSDEDDVIL